MRKNATRDQRTADKQRGDARLDSIERLGDLLARPMIQRQDVEEWLSAERELRAAEDKDDRE